MQLHLDRWWPGGRPSTRYGRGPWVAAGLVVALLVPFAVVAVVADVPGEGRAWPGQGFVVAVAVVLVAAGSLVAACRRPGARPDGS